MDRLTKLHAIGFTVVTLLIALFGYNHVLELRAEEPRRAIVAMEMLLRDSWFSPTINGWPYYNKPPVFNWVLAAFFALFGSFAEWVVRLPSLLSFLAVAFFNYHLVKYFSDRRVAVLAALFWLTSADLLFYGTVNAGEIDLFYSLLVFCQVASILLFFERQQYLRLFVATYFFCAIGTLTKGPPSIAFQGITLVAWMLIHKRWRLLFSWQHMVGIALFILIVGGYFFAYDYAGGDGVAFAVRLFKEASMRTGAEHTLADTMMGFVAFLPFVVRLTLPWSILAVFAIRYDFWKVIRSNQLLLFCVVFVVANIPIYWLTPDHKARYLYPFFPFILTVIAYFYLHYHQALRKRAAVVEHFFLGIMVVTCLAILLLPVLPFLQAVPWFWLDSIGAFLVAALVTFAYWRRPALRIYLLAAFLVFGRLIFNVVYLPYEKDRTSAFLYQDKVSEILEITDHGSVHWYGRPYQFTSDASIGPVQFKQVEIETAPLLAYQIPYYITKGTGQVMQFDTLLQAGQYYLAPVSGIDTSTVDIQYQLRDDWLKQDLVLFRYDEQ